MENPSKQDWIHSVEKDPEFLDIFQSYDDIQELSKFQFKSFLDKVTEAKALMYLNTIKLKFGIELDQNFNRSYACIVQWGQGSCDVFY
jgi:hypothetical protein